MNSTFPDRLASHCSVLAEIVPDERADVLATEAQAVCTPAGALLFEQKAPCPGFPMVLRGKVDHDTIREERGHAY